MGAYLVPDLPMMADVNSSVTQTEVLVAVAAAAAVVIAIVFGCSLVGVGVAAEGSCGVVVDIEEPRLSYFGLDIEDRSCFDLAQPRFLFDCVVVGVDVDYA